MPPIGSSAVASAWSQSYMRRMAQRRRQSGEEDPVLVALGSRIAEAMARRGKRISDVAEACGVQWQTAQKWTRGEAYPQVAQLPGLLRVLSMTAEQLLGIAAGQEPPFAAWAAFVASADGQAATLGEMAALRGIAWPDGREPTLGAYTLALAALRMGVARQA